MFGPLFGAPLFTQRPDWGDIARAFAPANLCAPNGAARPPRGPGAAFATDLLEVAFREGGERFSQALRRRRDLIDALLYDAKRLDKRDRQALETADAPEALIVAHPKGRRPVCVYPSAKAWSMSIDAETRLLSLVGPGASALTAAAFARQIADARGEPVLTAAPSREPLDLILDLIAPVERSIGRPQGGAVRTDRRRITALLQLLERAAQLRVVISHGLGGVTLSDLMTAEAAAAQERRKPIAPAGLRLVTLGGAPSLPSRFETSHGVGAFDAFGWAISDPVESMAQVAPFSGPAVNPRTPGALPLAGMLEDMIGDLAPAPGRTGGRAAG